MGQRGLQLLGVFLYRESVSTVATSFIVIWPVFLISLWFSFLLSNCHVFLSTATYILAFGADTAFGTLGILVREDTKLSTPVMGGVEEDSEACSCFLALRMQYSTHYYYPLVPAAGQFATTLCVPGPSPILPPHTPPCSEGLLDIALLF